MSEDTPANWEADSPSVDAEVEALQAEVKGLKEQVLRFATEAENTARKRGLTHKRVANRRLRARDRHGVPHGAAALARQPQG